MAKISVIGAGSWGTALAWLLHNNGHEVTVWSIMEAEVQMLRKEREHKQKLPGVALPEDMIFTSDLRSFGACGAITVYQKHPPFHEAFCEGRTINRQRCKGD